jgi:hypothetical protein
MNASLVGELFRLRYRLLWANMRSRNGKIALFFTGYLLLVLIMMLLMAGGLGAGITAVRSGKAQTVAQAVLAGLFVQTLTATVLMGFGMNAIFSDLELRRYPLAESERRFTRHLVGIVDPFWFLSLALEFGLAFGLYILGAASLWLGTIAILLLFISNYLLARVLGLLVERLLKHKAGSFILLAIILAISVLVGSIGRWIDTPGIGKTLVTVLAYTPPFGSAAAMSGAGFSALSGFAVLALWLIGLTAALVALERSPASRRIDVKTTEIMWKNPPERLAVLLGMKNAELVGYWLRLYMRNGRFRTIYLLSIPLAAFLTFNLGGHDDANRIFAAALGMFPMVTFLASARFTLNQFGYTGGAFRRYFLLPVDPPDILRTGSYASLLLGASLLPFAALLWVALAPVAFDARMLFMLLASGLAGLFGLHGLGLWATLFGPRRGNYNQALGNDLSVLGNIVLIGGMVALMIVPQVLMKVDPEVISPDSWWLTIPVVLLNVLFYVYSLVTASALFPKRREQLMAIVEGRN